MVQNIHKKYLSDVIFPVHCCTNTSVCSTLFLGEHQHSESALVASSASVAALLLPVPRNMQSMPENDHLEVVNGDIDELLAHNVPKPRPVTKAVTTTTLTTLLSPAGAVVVGGNSTAAQQSLDDWLNEM